MPSAFATVTVKVKCSSNWSEQTTIAQVTKQAKEDALGQLATAFKDRNDMTIVGTPKITAVHTDLDPQK